jgi:hypothetical protein
LAAWLVLLAVSKFQVSQIGLVPKKNSNKFRTIFHLSYPKSGSTSINFRISKEDFSSTLQYGTIDDAIEDIKQSGPGCFLAIKLTLNQLLDSYQSIQMTINCWACAGKGNTIMIRFFHLA